MTAKKPVQVWRSKVRPLTPKEIQVFLLLADGHTNADICEALEIKLGTLKNYNHSIYRKLGLKSRAEVMVKFRTGELEPETMAQLKDSQ